MENELKEDDYVLYVGKVRHWRGLYIVHSINADGTLLVRDKHGAQISTCRPADFKLVYRPTGEEQAQASKQGLLKCVVMLQVTRHIRYPSGDETTRTDPCKYDDIIRVEEKSAVEQRARETFLEQFPDATHIEVTETTFEELS